jgi:hypothetical protein
MKKTRTREVPRDLIDANLESAFAEYERLRPSGAVAHIDAQSQPREERWVMMTLRRRPEWTPSEVAAVMGLKHVAGSYVCPSRFCDRKPSIVIDEEDKAWRCYLCQQWGNALDLVGMAHTQAKGLVYDRVQAAIHLYCEPAIGYTPGSLASRPKNSGHRVELFLGVEERRALFRYLREERNGDVPFDRETFREVEEQTARKLLHFALQVKDFLP